jgi:hypothetical protein
MSNIKFLNGNYHLETNEFIYGTNLNPEINLNYDFGEINSHIQKLIKNRLFYENLGVEKGNKLIDYIRNGINGNHSDKIIVLIGPGNNGKTFLTSCIENALDNLVVRLPMNLLNNSKICELVEKIELKKVALLTNEENIKIDSGLIKTLCGTDKLVLNSEKEFINKTLFMIETNKEINIDVDNISLLRRIEYFEFNKRYVNEYKEVLEWNDIRKDKSFEEFTKSETFKINLISILLN